MKQIEKLSEGTSYTAVSIGKLAELNEHVLVLSPEIQIPGKVFLSFPVGGETGFVHTHNTHEEIYIFVQGKGEFQVDGKVFPIGEGSVVRVAPAPKRSVRNIGNEPLIMICIQYKADSFTPEDATDGKILAEPVVW